MKTTIWTLSAILCATLPAFAQRIEGASTRALTSGVPAKGVSADVSELIGTLPAGKSITITFDVTVNDPLPQGVSEVSN